MYLYIKNILEYAQIVVAHANSWILDIKLHEGHSNKGENIQNDGDKLICHINCLPHVDDEDYFTTFIARNFNTGEKISEINPKLHASEFRVYWPYLIFIGSNDNPEPDFKDGIRIFNMENETLIKYIEFYFPTAGYQHSIF